MLGEKLLSAELKATKDAPIIYPFRYYEVKRQIDELEGMLRDNIQAQAYRYQMLPTEPLKKINLKSSDFGIRSIVRRDAGYCKCINKFRYY
ncbi:hypothetical protein PCI56_17260 [Plesiomonas shigelloides subsp. oncorhynchi]|nr:hypothetical protein [Plesiomonas shigelloides]